MKCPKKLFKLSHSTSFHLNKGNKCSYTRTTSLIITATVNLRRDAANRYYAELNTIRYDGNLGTRDYRMLAVDATLLNVVEIDVKCLKLMVGVI